ncbi:DRAP deaminase, partial [Kappamyces sp. JEL0680]
MNESPVGTEALAGASDHSYMQLAIAQAGRCVPLPSAFSVGACLVSPAGTVLATGYSRELPGNTHAEECCLLKLADRSLAKGATIYSTMEPCGKRLSGNRCCALLIIEAGIARVVQ